MKSPLQKAMDPKDFRQQAHQMVDMLADYFEEVREGEKGSVLNWQPPENAVAKWQEEIDSHEKDPTELFKGILRDAIHVHHPQFAGHQLSPIAPLAATASLLTDFLNNGTGIYEMGAPGSMMEFAVIRKVAQAMGLPDEAEGFLTSGGTLANLTALLAARSFKASSNVWKEGNETELAIMVSEQAHYSIDRAVRIMGWGEGGIIKVPADEKFRMNTELLEQSFAKAKAAGKHVVAVVGSACSTATGSFDDLEAIADFCEQYDLWFHVDGAHGGALCFSKKYQHKLNGIHRAHSVIMDFHKMLLTPVLTTAVIFRDKELSFHTFSQKADYLFNKTAEKEWFNLALRTFECTKPSLAIPVYTLLKTYGEDLFDEFVTLLCDNGQTFAGLIHNHPDFELAYQPECNILCFRFVKKEMDANSLDELNRRIRTAIVEAGDFYIVQTQLNGRQWFRTTLGSPFTNEKHLQSLLEEIKKFGDQL
ncbi:MAG: aminotransferase class I/II-fold pyridoxal phosphate-dependent enzyme [Bacteroidetes bacterium]|nr:MAG: aminotransferase class I/II-fold pyridoxal phosphate-dependent enzyme [Bacteroidota bacterium]